MRYPEQRQGTSLLELVIGLAVGGIILLSGRLAVEQVVAAAERMAESGARAESGVNAARLLRATVASTESATVVSSAVRGTSASAEIESWCDVPAGWQERCVLALRIIAGVEGNRLVAVFGTDTVVVRRGFGAGTLRYIADAAHGGTWTTEWLSEITTPVAVAIIMDTDTLILRIGERG